MTPSLRCLPSRVVASTLAGALLAVALEAQVPGGRWETVDLHRGLSSGANMGVSVAGGGDFDGDGVADYLVGAPRESVWPHQGSAYVFSGADGSMLAEFHETSSPNDRFGHAVAFAGDVDGDGRDDVLVSMPTSGSSLFTGAVYLYAGGTGTLIRSYVSPLTDTLFGDCLLKTGDVDGDGVPDHLVAAPRTSTSGGFSELHLYSGASGALLWSVGPGTSFSLWGRSLALTDDRDGDGIRDLLVGEPHGVQFNGAVYVLSAADGSTLDQDLGTYFHENLGMALAALDDLDGDGVADYAVGAEGFPWTPNSDGGVEVRSGATHLAIHRIGGDDGSDFGAAIASIGDIDDDGFDDLAIGAPLASRGFLVRCGHVSVHSASTSYELGRYWGLNGAYLGSSVAGAGDLDGDGIPEFLAGAPFTDVGSFNEAGEAYLLRRNPFLRVGGGEISASAGTPLPVQVDFPAAAGGASYVLLASLAGLGNAGYLGMNVPLAPDALYALSAAGGMPAAVLAGASGTLDANGDALAGLMPVVATAARVGRSLHLSAVAYDPGTMTAVAVTAARRVTVVP